MSTFFECSNYSRFVLSSFMFLLFCFVLFFSLALPSQFSSLGLCFWCCFFVFLFVCFLFCFVLFFLVVFLAPFSQSSSYILSKLLPLTKNNAFPFIYFQYHCLASLGRFFFFFFFFRSQPPPFCSNPVFVLFCFFFGLFYFLFFFF